MPAKVVASNTTIWQALEAWANSLAPWQRKIIEMSVSHGRLSEAEVQEVYAEFLAPTTGRPVSISEPTIGTQSAVQPLILDKINGINGVNALPEDAALTFGPNLTIIFGKNGTGKSGFVRIVANACFSRSKPPILPNIYADSAAAGYSATFHVKLDGEAQDPILFISGATGPLILGRITVFDSAVARQHVSQAAAFEFRPRGFDVFTEMARVYGELSKKLDIDIGAKAPDVNFGASFLETPTKVSQQVVDLSPTTDIERLRALGVFGDAERARLKEIGTQRAALRARSPSEILRNLRDARADVLALSSKLSSIKDDFAQVAADRRQALVTSAGNAAASAALLGSDKFKRPFFRAVGSPEWETFAKSAHALGKMEDASYPEGDEACLLCERPLDEKARHHIDALFEFVEGDAQKLAAQSRQALGAETEYLTNVQIPDFSGDARVRTHISRLHPETERVLERVVEELQAVKKSTLATLRSEEGEFLVVDLTDAETSLQALTAQIDADLQRMETENIEAAIASIDQEWQLLRHRQVLAQLLPQIEIRLANLKFVREMEARRSSLVTTHITNKEKELFTQIFTGSYKERFSEECRALGCDVPVELQTVGRSGQTMRSLSVGGHHKPESILSEGEQKAVALADFFTEVAMNPNAAGIVLDDPVTSQDFQRRKKIASRLVEEASHRQVVIFTHDLVFLNQLITASEDQGIELVTHIIQRDPEGRPGIVALDERPDTDGAYKTTQKASGYLATAKSTIGTAQSEAITKGMGALRTTIEVAVADKLLKGIVKRWDEQIRVGALRKMDWNEAKVEEICVLYEDISRYIDAHSHSDESTGGPPEISDLQERITAVDALIAWAKREKN